MTKSIILNHEVSVDKELIVDSYYPTPLITYTTIKSQWEKDIEVSLTTD